jgi:hypothetical protein
MFASHSMKTVADIGFLQCGAAGAQYASSTPRTGARAQAEWRGLNIGAGPAIMPPARVAALDARPIGSTAWARSDLAETSGDVE